MRVWFKPEYVLIGFLEARLHAMDPEHWSLRGSTCGDPFFQSNSASLYLYC
jgi:hypothetical protein